MSTAILYVNTPTYTGGAEISLLTLISNLDPKRYRAVLVTSGEGQFAERARGFGVDTRIMTFPWLSRRKPWEFVNSIGRMIDVTARENIALIHTNCPNASRQVYWTGRSRRIPYVAHIRDFRHAWSLPHNIRFLQHAHCIVANSQAVAHHFVGLGVSNACTKVINNPVDITALSAPIMQGEKSRVRALFGIPDDALLIGLVGQIQEIKGHEDLVRSAPSIIERLPEVHFAIVGAAFDSKAQEYEHLLVELIREFCLTERFHLIGFQDDIRTVMQCIDILVVPSWEESFGRVVVEGMAAGCPVVGTNVGGVPEIIRDGENGLLVQPHQPLEIATAVITLAEQVDLKQEIIRQGRMTARRFSIDAHVSEVQSLYDTLLSPSRNGQ